MTRSRKTTLLILVFTFLHLGSVHSARAQKPSVMEADQPRRGTVDLELRHDWTVGEGDLLIGEVGEIVVDEHGVIFVLDTQLGEVQVLSPDGEWLRSIGREGDGPGEFREPNDLFLTHDGKVAVVQQMPSKIALLTKDGVALDDQTLPDATDGYRLLLLGEASSNGMVLTRAQFLPRENGELGTTVFLEAMTASGESLGEMYRTNGGIDMEHMTLRERDIDNVTLYWTVTTDDRVAAVTTFDEYRIDVCGLDGSDLYSIRRDVPPRPRTQAEKDAAADRYQMSINGRDVEILPEENARVVDGLVARPEGGLWAILRESPEIERQADRVMRIDEFDREGHYLRQLILHGDVDPAIRDMYVRGDHLFVVASPNEGSEVAEVTLRRYALTLPVGR